MATRWTNEEDAVLARLYAAGVRRREIATRLGRSEDALDARRRSRGIPARRRRRPWSAAEDALIRAATAARVPASELAARIGRSSEALRRRRRELGLARVPSPRYSALEDDALRRCWLDGGDLAVLAAELGRSRESLHLRARALGLHKPERRFRWLPDEDLALRQAYGLGLTCTAISVEVLPGRSGGAIAARARKLGLAVYGRTWSADDDRRLKASTAARTPLEEVASLLFRTPEALRRRARKLGLEPLRPAPHENAHRRWREDDALLRRHASHDPGALARLLGRSDHAVRRQLALLGLRRGRERSPHHELVVASAGLTPAERRLLARELTEASGPRLLSLSRRLGRSPGALKRMLLESDGVEMAGRR